MRTNLIVLGLPGIIAAIVGALVIGNMRWRRRTAALRAALTSARLSVTPLTFDAREIANLPAPVQRYFRAVLRDGQPVIAAVRLAHIGQFNMADGTPKWRPFHSSQRVTTRPPGFDWEGHIRMMPALTAKVHDAYIAGEGILHAELFGLVTLADIRGTPEAAAGELLRYLIEAAWYPTALLPSQGVRWEPIDDRSARAILTDGSTTVSLDFSFEATGTIASARAAARIRKVVDGVSQYAPWQGRFWNYATRNGMQIPLQGEVAWDLPGGLSPYWRGEIIEVAYEFAE